MCRRWRDLPKPTIAAVQGACIAGGLMLAWVCDLIVATDDAFFQDPVNRMGIPGVEYFAHGFELPPRVAKEFILLGRRMPAERAYQFGMVNAVVTRDRLDDECREIALELADRPPLGNWLTKQALNHVEDLRGKRTAMDAVFHMHHFAHAQNSLTSDDHLGGLDASSMAKANKEQAERAADHRWSMPLHGPRTDDYGTGVSVSSVVSSYDRRAVRGEPVRAGGEGGSA